MKMISRKIGTKLEQLNNNIQSCQKCELCKLEFNIKDVSQGFGKLYGWKGGTNKCRFLFIGMNPSHNRFQNLEFAFGGRDENQGPGKAFVNTLKESGVINEIYVTNLIKCSSSSNTINETWINCCILHLLNEIEILRPTKIITMGSQVYDFLSVYFTNNNIQIKIQNIWHPSYVFSYRRVSKEQYIKKIKKAAS